MEGMKEARNLSNAESWELNHAARQVQIALETLPVKARESTYKRIVALAAGGPCLAVRAMCLGILSASVQDTMPQHQAEVADLLIAAAEDKSPVIRVQALCILGAPCWQGDPRGVEVLKKTVADRNELNSVRVRAGLSLSHLGPQPLVVRNLIEVMEKELLQPEDKRDKLTITRCWIALQATTGEKFEDNVEAWKGVLKKLEGQAGKQAK
jgi:hypothetical protein